jgi:hypothetical protein
MLVIIKEKLRFLDLKTLFIFALILQTVFFSLIVFIRKDNLLYADFSFYEDAAWNLSSGKGLTHSRSFFDDPYLTNLYYQSHPDATQTDYIPATAMPIGYSIYLGGIYYLFGRNLVAAVFANWFLLLIFISVTFLLTKKAFGEGLLAKITLFLIAFFPFWAYWATTIGGDILHMMLLTLFAFFFFRTDEKFSSLLLSGIMLGLACIVRPYPILLPFVFLIGIFVFRNPAFTLKRIAVIALSCWLIVGVWGIRNYYHFGKPMLTSIGVGYSLWVASYKDIFHDATSDQFVTDELQRLGISDIHFHNDNLKLQEIAINRIKAEPLRYGLATLTSGARLWIPLGGSKMPIFAKLLLLVFYFSLFVLMLWGIWLSRKSKNPILIGGIVLMFYYTVVFMPLTLESRYMLPVRFFSFLFISIGINRLVQNFFSIKSTTLSELKQI